jgi:hypothetical protein
MKNTYADRPTPTIHLGRDQQARLRAVAERVFPTGTRLITLPGEAEFVLLASWKLGTDPTRPNKRSKTVRIGISQEAMEEYGRSAIGGSEHADKRLESFLRKNFARLNPSHDAPLGTEPPVEKWHFSAIELNG